MQANAKLIHAKNLRNLNYAGNGLVMGSQVRGVGRQWGARGGAAMQSQVHGVQR